MTAAAKNLIQSELTMNNNERDHSLADTASSILAFLVFFKHLSIADIINVCLKNYPSCLPNYVLD